METITVKCICNDEMPIYAHETDAGADLRVKESVTLRPLERKIIGSGVHIDVPEGYVALVFPRSGMASRQGVTLANAVGVIDCGYHGEIGLPLLNSGTKTVTIDKYTRVAQLVIVPYVKADFVKTEMFERSERGTGGFGSTGVE